MLGFFDWTSLWFLVVPGVVGAGIGVLNEVGQRRLKRRVAERESELRRELEPFQTSTSNDDVMTMLRAIQQITPSRMDDGAATASSEIARAVEEVFERVDRLEKADKTLGVRSAALLEVYHRQGLSQSRMSFWFSLLLGTAGVGVIAVAVFTRSQAVGTYIGGAVTEALAGLIFTQSKQAQQVMSDSFDRARDDRRLEEALGLADRMVEAPLRDALQAVLALELVQAKTPASVLPGLQQLATANPSNGNGGHDATGAQR